MQQKRFLLARRASLSQPEPDSSNTLEANGMQGLVDDSVHLKDLAKKLWNESLRKTKRRILPQYLTKDTIVGWIDTYPILNEETHNATIMDPKVGKLAWVERYLKPLG